jgi:acetyl esterase
MTRHAVPGMPQPPARARALDRDAARLLELMQRAGYPPFETLTPAAARAAYAASWDAMQSPGGDVAAVADVSIDGPAGALPLRIYRGLGADPHTPLPCMLFLHGGGWVIGNLESHDRMCRRLATVAGICVVAVDYRLAPEHPFPAALDDAAAALRWVHAHAVERGIDPAGIGIGGDSAGGNLAAALALMGRDGTVPSCCYQALIYPALDLTADTGSYRGAAHDLPLTAATMRYFIGHYTPHAGDRLDWRASPLRAGSLVGAPPALVLTVAHDPLCDEGRAYAQRLDDEGVRVAAMHCNDQTHGLLGQGRLVPAADVIGDQVFGLIGFELHRSCGHAFRFSRHPTRSSP